MATETKDNNKIKVAYSTEFPLTDRVTVQLSHDWLRHILLKRVNGRFLDREEFKTMRGVLTEEYLKKLPPATLVLLYEECNLIFDRYTHTWETDGATLLAIAKGEQQPPAVKIVEPPQLKVLVKGTGIELGKPDEPPQDKPPAGVVTTVVTQGATGTFDSVSTGVVYGPIVQHSFYADKTLLPCCLLMASNCTCPSCYKWGGLADCNMYDASRFEKLHDCCRLRLQGLTCGDCQLRCRSAATALGLEHKK